MMLIVTCASCKADNPYVIKEYLNYLANKSGIGTSTNFEDNFNALNNWKIIYKTDNAILNDELDYAYLSKTICNLIEENGNPLDVLKQKGWIKNNIKENKTVNKDTAESIVDKAVDIINNKSFEKKYDYKYTQEVKSFNDELNNGDLIFDEKNQIYMIVVDSANNVYRDAEYDEVFSKLDIADSFVVDFSQSEILPLQEELVDTSYVNNKYNLLASKNHVFNKDGFRISYTINTSGIDVHVSKKIDKTTVYGDASINRVKPTFKWTSSKGDLKNCYFNLSFDTTTSVGATMGKYGNYYLQFKDLDSSSFMSKLKSMVVPKQDVVEASIPICKVKTPIPNVPFAYINMTIGIKLYASGKVELVMYNTHNIGFEVKNGNARFFYDHKDDIDTIARASTKAALALNVGLEEAKFTLCDVELDGGVKAELKTTVHLYDGDGDVNTVSSDIEYSTIDEISKGNPDVQVCGDVSLYWMLDLICNTSDSMLYKLGFTKTYNILDEDNQVFGNMHHIENGQFVKTCTRKNRTVNTNNNLNVNATNKIILNTYAEVMLENESFNIEIINLPSAYTLNDIRYTSSDTSIATVQDGTIKAIKSGSCKINVHTSDNKYNTYINVLVSTG